MLGHDGPLHRRREIRSVTKVVFMPQNGLMRWPGPPPNPRSRHLLVGAALLATVVPTSRGKTNVTKLETRVFSDADTGLALPYRLFVPAGCDARNPCGLLLLLHGAGERGTDNEAQLKNDALAWIAPDTQAEHPTIVVYPQCPPGAQWVETPWDQGSYSIAKTPISKPMAAVVKLLTALRKELPVDPRRLFVTGMSMGGYGTFDLIARNPGMFAGALPLCGGGDPSKAAAIRDLPIWVFHGDSDPVVPVRGSRQMVKALRAAGGSPRYAEIAGGSHNMWNPAYQNLEVVRWLLSQKRAPAMAR
jgi:predicted peptidase